MTAGLGVGVLPHFMARASGLHCLQRDSSADQPLWLVMHADLATSGRVRAVADHLIGLFSECREQLER